MHSLTSIGSIVILLFSLSNIYCDKSVDTNILQQLIDRLNDADKQKIFQSLFQISDQGRQDNSNWCCSIDPGKHICSWVNR